jgi:catechol 2,3-dioxygenase-like lactoylglutathione lyase family enzyme
MSCFLRFEGGHIGVSSDRQAAAAWYCRHLGLTLAWDSPEEGQSLLPFSKRHALVLVSVAGGTEVNLWGNTGNLVRDSNVRLSLAVPDLGATWAVLAAGGVRVNPIVTGPGGRAYFTFYDLDGTCLEAAARPDLLADFPNERFAGYAAARTGVRDLDAAVTWYQEFAGMTVLQDLREEGAVLLGLNEGNPLWLERLAQGAHRGPGYTRPYLATPDIQQAHAFCAARNLRPAPVLGNPNALQVFSFQDLEGNSLYCWTYPGVQI